MIDPRTLEQLVQNGCCAADNLVIGFQGTPAAKTRLAVQSALIALEANGLITITDIDNWPRYFVPEAPYGTTND